MNDILDDLSSWLDLLVVERRYRQQSGEEPRADMDLVTRAIDEITPYARRWQRKTQVPKLLDGLIRQLHS
jgi:hypothetical protein